MGDTVEQWRATIGQWSGGRLGNNVRLETHTDQTSNNVSYRQIRFVLLLSLLVIGCVELNPGPDHVSKVIHRDTHLCMSICCVGNSVLREREGMANNG
jgi:hypothetical protein